MWRWQTQEFVSNSWSALLVKSRLRSMPSPATNEPPVPPAWLRIRVGQINPRFYLLNGPKLFGNLKRLVEKYAKFEDFNRVLDWGCGCGRVSRITLKHVPAGRLYGCDIDADAIHWMQQTFQGSSFTVINPYPPTPYADAYFDFIYGISVFTHLDEDLQFKWLAELRRITRKDGIVAVSVNSGDPSTDPALQKQLAAAGFADRAGDKEILFRHFLQKGYYRLTKHSREYVLREWSNYFEILEYVPNGLVRQDLVIMQRP